MDRLSTAISGGGVPALRRRTRTPRGDTAEISVLVVDSESLIRWSLSETLRDCGVLVQTANDHQSAIAIVATSTRPFDLILFDWHLLSVSEWAQLQRLVEMSPSSAIVVMMAFPTAELESEALRLGASAVLRKPFELEHVTALVRELVEPPTC